MNKAFPPAFIKLILLGTMALAGLPAPQVSITTEGESRVIRANGIPAHATGQFPCRGNPNSISAQNYTFRMPLHPKENKEFTPLERQAIGIALNGVPFDPGTAEYWNGDHNWHGEAIVGSNKKLGIDQSNAHVQPNGAYHYHGIPEGLVQKLPKARMTLIGYAADGFPIYGQNAYSDPLNSKSAVRPMRPSWQLKKGKRPTGNAGPGGAYDGTYTQDYQFVASSGDLDEANGRRGVTPEYPKGTYYYVATDSFPFYPRMLKGTPDPSFERHGPGGPGGPGGGRSGPGGRGHHHGPPPKGQRPTPEL